MRPADTSREVVLRLSTDPALRHRFLVLDEPIPGNVRFGLLLEELDRLAGEIALAHARRAAPGARVVTAAVDEILMRGIASPERDLACRGRINRVGRTSMEIGIRVEQEGGVHLASCYFTMVARDGDGPSARSIAVPAIEPGDEVERARARKASGRAASYRAQAAAAVEAPSHEEYQALAPLHLAQDGHGFRGLLASALQAESWERTYPEQENLSRIIFGGYIMRRAYELSSICAERAATHRPVIAAVNRVNFIHPVHIGDKLHLTSRVVYTEGAALCVETGIERVSRDRTARALSNSCLFTFLNVDPDLVPREAPPVHPATYAEDARWLAARRNLRALAGRLRGPWLGLGGGGLPPKAAPAK
ncbi:MAG TPA: hotdog domain-containing protein [Anaeromyxobacteraceae bacterium]|nr:hotdog domain-containing protein [Anaeromyxobacteraceae bacterium]